MDTSIYYSRKISKQVQKLKKGFPVVSITGPRQSGKTTFLQHQFPDFKYFNLENPQTSAFIESDPQQFFNQNQDKLIIDEVQRLPDLLSYIQVLVDSTHKMGGIIISGSQNLLISERISQSLAGRAAYQTIMPFSIEELKEHSLLKRDRLEQIVFGFYPALYTRDVDSSLYYNQYIATYVERDARLIRNISNLTQFRNFISLLAGRVGQILNVASLANDTGIAPNTAEDWLSILEASYLVYRLQPYYKNVGKRLIKSPKIYFYDTGLLCTLLNISSKQELAQHYMVGGIFENYVISEFVKHLSNTNKPASLFFYRDNHGNEIDLIVDTGTTLLPVEIKSAVTFSNNFFKGLNYWRSHINADAQGYVVYGGTENQTIKGDILVSWDTLETVFRHIQ